MVKREGRGFPGVEPLRPSAREDGKLWGGVGRDTHPREPLLTCISSFLPQTVLSPVTALLRYIPTPKLFCIRKLHCDFPGGPVGTTLCSQYRGPGFLPWPGN